MNLNRYIPLWANLLAGVVGGLAGGGLSSKLRQLDLKEYQSEAFWYAVLGATLVLILVGLLFGRQQA